MIFLNICSSQKNKQEILLLGVGYAAYKSSRPSFFGGNLLPNEEEGNMKVISVCDSEGTILWFDPEHLKVVKVDGVEIGEIDMI